MPLSSISSALFSWVQRPVVVQFVLPVQTRLGVPAASLSTRNLLCASAPGATKRFFSSTSTPCSSSVLRAASFSSRLRASAVGSCLFASIEPFASTRCARGPSLTRRAISSSSPSSNSAA